MRSQLTIRRYSYNLFLGYASCILASILLAIFFETPIPLLVPIVLAAGFQTLVDYEKIYLLLFMCIPLSTEVSISDHLATDLPTEPLIVGLMLIYFFIALTNPTKISLSFLRHPLSVFIILHFSWIGFTTLTSSEITFSAKFLLAKLWYIITFFYFTGHVVTNTKKIDLLIWLLAIPLTIATTKVIVHHSMLDFGFKTINEACPPFFRNHVNYAAILTVFFPFIWYLRKWSLGGARRIAEIAMIILFFGMLTAYTRAAYVAFLMLPFAYITIRARLTKLAVILASITIFGVVSYLITENRFMQLVPTDQTVAHTELRDIVSSTSELKDVSTMERYYRWIAGAQMIAEKPYLGFGPGNFYHFYKSYALDRFATYVSNNPEKSGIHNYYLMTTVEQGLIGLFIFLFLVYMVVIYGEIVYHQCSTQKSKDIVMAAILSSIMIDAFLLMNDMIETDKIGSFFFFNIAIIVLMDLFNKKEKEKQIQNEVLNPQE